MKINLRYAKLLITYFINKMLQITLRQPDIFIKHALACLEKRLVYQSDVLSSSFEVRDYLRLQLASEDNEVFAVLFLSNHHRVIAFEKLFFGTINTTAVHPRVIAQKALKHNAAAVIVAHNHPSGSLMPSAADQYITTQLQTALRLLDVRLLDHIIVSQEGTFSFAERGLL